MEKIDNIVKTRSLQSFINSWKAERYSWKDKKAMKTLSQVLEYLIIQEEKI